jgi:glutamate racemase
VNDSPIGIFDSGIGGLTVFSAIKKHLPNETLLYLGDTARVPYGTKSAETVVRYSRENAQFLEEKGVKAIVVACNTASAVALEDLRQRCRVPVLGVVEPGVRAALAASQAKRIGVIGTRATITSDAYGALLRELHANTHVVSVACPLFVPLVEEGWLHGEIVEEITKRYCAELEYAQIDTLILGCTHYPLLKDAIAKVVGPAVALVDSGEAAAAALAHLIDNEGIQASGTRPDDCLFVTDVPGQFEAVARRFLGGMMPAVERVNLGF